LWNCFHAGLTLVSLCTGFKLCVCLPQPTTPCFLQIHSCLRLTPIVSAQEMVI
jgi:hypothetical protein